MTTRSDDKDHHGRTGDGPSAKPAAHEAPHQTLAAGASPISVCSTTCSSSSSSSSSSASPASCASYFGVSTDARSLLAETEQFLAILDTAASAFTAATDVTVPIADNTSALRDEGTPASLALDMAQVPQPPVRQRQNATRPGEKKKKKKTRKSPNDELAQLRSAVQMLEAKLTPLRQENRLASRHNQIWQELAMRQLRWRRHAENENQQLKTMLQQVLQAANPQQLDTFYALSMTDQLPNYLHGPRKLPIAPPAMRDDATALTSVCASLLRRLDAGFAEIDAVFRENGIDQSLTESRAYAEKKTQRLGEPCHLLEVVYVDLVPFDWRRFGNTLWNCTREWHLKDDPYVYQSADRPKDTFAVNYRVTSKPQGNNNSSGQLSANYTLAVRRYWQADRFVMVYASLSHGENELAGASVSDISYVVASNVSSLSEAGSPPVSVVQSCLHLFPTSGDACEGEDGQGKAQSLLNLIVDVIQENIAHSRRRVDSSLLLQGTRSSAGEDDEQTPRIRCVFGPTPAHALRVQQAPLAAGGSASSSSSSSSWRAMDACSLLAETEEVLAIIHAAATFAATAVTAPNVDSARYRNVSSSDEDSPGMMHSCPAESTTSKSSGDEPFPSRQRHSSPTRSRGTEKKKKRTPKEQLAKLREVVHNHESELALLRQENRLATRHKQIWQELASRQVRWRQFAETENQQLKTILHHVLHATTDPRHLDQQIEEALRMMDQLPNYLHGRQKKEKASLRDDAALASVFESLLQRLDTGFAEIDAVFRENGMDQSLTEPRAYAERKTRRLGEACSFIEIVKVHLMPFDWRRFGNAVWECTCEWHLKDDVYVYPSVDRPEDTFAINYRVMATSPINSNSEESANVTLAVRRYWQADRFVIVYASQLNGENELAGASVSDISCIVASDVSSLSEPGSSPVSVIQSCLHLFPAAGGSHGQEDQEKAQILLNLTIDAIQEDISHTQRRVDSSLLLQGSRAPNPPLNEEEDEQTHRIRFAFKDRGR